MFHFKTHRISFFKTSTALWIVHTPTARLVLTLSILLQTLTSAACLGADENQPLAPLVAARSMVVPDGFQVSLFAGEPDVQQPISFCMDDRGRLWVAEAYNYPHHGDSPGDRILIFEDEDGDGRFDKRTIFYDQLNYVTGIEVGFGGAWVMSPPYFYFIADRDGDDKPDSRPQILLDGFGTHANAHNLANGFAWGPDGWLYGTHGRTNWSLPGKPGTPENQRIRFDGGVYRYHPVRHIWEPFADGTTNPWGIDFDDFGQAFVCNCVNPHLFHVIQGAHYEPWRDRESSKYAYRRIDTIADHLHYVGGSDIRDGIGSHAEDLAGGGHAHCGTMVYLGDNWPDRYRNTVFMNNVHGRRINNDILRRSGSGYIASHGPDIALAKDPWFMGVTLMFGPDGAVFASDWSDTGECHSRINTRRHTGRIFKISYGQPERAPVDLGRLDNLQLVKLQLHHNDWYVRHARRILQERAAAGQSMSTVHAELQQMLNEQTDVTRRLRALWALYVTGGANRQQLEYLLDDRNEYLRAWSIRLLSERPNLPPAILTRFRNLAARGNSPFVRLHVASALQRMEPRRRWPIAEALLSRSEDADDPNLPLMNWYAIQSLAENDVERFVKLIPVTEIPLVRRHIARRAASRSPTAAGIHALTQLIGRSEKTSIQSDIVDGLLRGLEGRRSVPMPSGWQTAYHRLRASEEESIRQKVLRLALIYNDERALQLLRKQSINQSAPAELRVQAIEALVAKIDEEFDVTLLQLVADRDVSRAAIRGLAEYNHPETASVILEQYSTWNQATRQDAMQTLASRTHWAHELLDRIKADQIPSADLTAYTVRQLHNLDSESLIDKIKSVWGNIRTTSEEKADLITALKRRLTPEHLERSDLAAGRRLFAQHCANCHRFFDAGEEVGPDITGAQRTNIDYLLENLIDPSAAVAKDFQMEVVVTTAGRTMTGLVTASNDTSLTLQTVNEKVIVPLDEIEQRTTSPLSMMPDGLLQKLTAEQIRDLIAYLASPVQVSPGDPADDTTVDTHAATHPASSPNH